jgi:hypothetical protein
VAKYWKNGVPVILTDGTHDAQAASITLVGTDVYAAGGEYALMPGGFTASGAKYWKNGYPVVLSQGGYGAFAYALAVSGSDVYVVGSHLFTARPSVPRAVVWKNGTEGVLVDGARLGGEATAITLAGTDVYIAGREVARISPSGSTIGIATYWKNETVVELTDGTRDAAAKAIVVISQ